jgi:hypothetical protein
MSFKNSLVASLVLLHLLSVALFIWADWPERTPRRLQTVLRIYQNFSGSFRDYAFFAPAVGTDLKAGFLLEKSTGRESRFINFLAAGTEVRFRYNCILLASMRDQRARDLFAQSWSALVLGANPDMDRVTVMVKEFVLPSLRDFRRGQRPRWEAIYAGKFGRRDIHVDEHL